MGSSSSKKERELKEQEEKLKKQKEELQKQEEELKRKEKEMINQEIRRNEIQKMKETNNILDYKREILFPNKIVLTKEQTEIILSQMTHSLCKILNNDKGYGTGFFCLLKFSEKQNPLKTLITNNHVLDIEDIGPDKSIKITINDCVISRRIEIGGKRKVYTNIEYDVTIVEIIEEDHLGFIKYLEIDEKVFYPINEIKKKYDKVYVIHYPGKITRVTSSFGDMTIQDDFQITHHCGTEPGSSGSPILDLLTYQVMGIHKGSILNNNVGTFLKMPIEEFKEYNKNGILDNYLRLKSKVKKIQKEVIKKDNLIKLTLSVNKYDVKKKYIFFRKF